MEAIIVSSELANNNEFKDFAQDHFKIKAEIKRVSSELDVMIQANEYLAEENRILKNKLNAIKVIL